MQKRGFLFGEYDTALLGWTLSAWTLSNPVYRSTIVSVPGRDGDLDLSTVLTDGVPCYQNRTLSVTLELSEGCRLERDLLISATINKLDGMRMKIVGPDDLAHYLEGRVHVEMLYSNLAHASIRISAVVDPWRYALSETSVSVEAAEDEQTLMLVNRGRAALIPSIVVTGDDVRLSIDGASRVLSEGEYTLPDLVLKTGETVVRYSGNGNVKFVYREAIL